MDIRNLTRVSKLDCACAAVKCSVINRKIPGYRKALVAEHKRPSAYRKFSAYRYITVGCPAAPAGKFEIGIIHTPFKLGVCALACVSDNTSGGIRYTAGYALIAV